MSVYNDQELDALFRDATDAVSVPNSSAYWDSATNFIAAQKSTKKRFFIYFWFIGITLAGMIGIAGVSEFGFSQNSNQTNSISQKQTTDLPQNKAENESNTTLIIEEKSNAENTNDDNSVEILTPSANLVNEQNAIVSESKTHNEFLTQTNSEKPNENKQLETAFSAANLIDETEVAKNKTGHTNSQVTANSLPVPTPNETLVYETPAENITDKMPQQPSHVTQNTEIIEKDFISEPRLAERLDLMDPILIDSLPLPQSSFNLNPDYQKKPKSSNWNLLLGARIGPSFGFSHSIFSEKSNGIELLSDDKMNVTFSPALDVTLRKNSWLLSSGIEIQTYKNQFQCTALQLHDYQSPLYDDKSYWLVESTTFVFVDSVFYYDSGTPTYTTDTVRVQVNDSSYISKVDTTFQTNYDSTWAEKALNSQSSYLEIPLLVGYEFGNKKLKLALLTGVSFGFLTGYNYQPMELPASTSDATLLEPYQFKKTLVNFILKTRLSYPINSFGVYSDIYFRSNLNGLIGTNDHLEWKQNNLNIGLGVFYTF